MAALTPVWVQALNHLRAAVLEPLAGLEVVMFTRLWSGGKLMTCPYNRCASLWKNITCHGCTKVT